MPQIEVTDATAAWLETSAFIGRHPEWFACPQNGKALAQYCDKKKWPITVANLEKAFEALKASNQLIVPNRETLAKMTSKEVAAIAAANGQPVYDGDRLLGYKLDDRWTDAPPLVRVGGHLPKSQMQHPEDYGYTPTRREFAMWDSQRTQEWIKANGHDGHELPELR